jgi:Uma2 family endonuclease
MVLFAPLDVILAEDSVVQPDLLFIRKDRLAILKTEGVRGAPDLVVEVLSPGTAHHDRGAKRRLY